MTSTSKVERRLEMVLQRPLMLEEENLSAVSLTFRRRPGAGSGPPVNLGPSKSQDILRVVCPAGGTWVAQ